METWHSSPGTNCSNISLNSVIATVMRQPENIQFRLSHMTAQQHPISFHFLLPEICNMHQKPFLKFKVLPEKQEPLESLMLGIMTQHLVGWGSEKEKSVELDLELGSCPDSLPLLYKLEQVTWHPGSPHFAVKCEWFWFGSWVQPFWRVDVYIQTYLYIHVHNSFVHKCW